MKRYWISWTTTAPVCLALLLAGNQGFGFNVSLISVSHASPRAAKVCQEGKGQNERSNHRP